MKAANFKGNKEIVIEDVAKPQRQKGEVLVKVKACGLCGSEEKQWQPGTEVIPGHEITGKIVEVDAGSSLEAGTRAALYLPDYCGECFYCQQGKTNLCSNISDLLGHTVGGGYAEYIVVKENQIIPLEPEISYKEGVLLLDTIGTTHHNLRLLQAGNYDTALVTGCGPIGLGAVFGLRNMGVSRVYATDLIENRLQTAASLGAVPINVDEVDLQKYMRQEQPEGIPLVVDSVGAPFTLKDNIKIVQGGGKVGLIGEYWQEWNLKPHSDFMLKDWHLIRSWYFPLTEVKENMEILKYNKIADKIISHIFPLDQLSQAFKMFFNRETDKVIIEF